MQVCQRCGRETHIIYVTGKGRLCQVCIDKARNKLKMVLQEAIDERHNTGHPNIRDSDD